MATRTLSPSEIEFLTQLWTDWGDSGLPPTHQARAVLSRWLDEYRAGQLSLTPDQLGMIESLLSRTPDIREPGGQIVDAVLAFLPPWWRPLFKVPILGRFLVGIAGLLGSIIERAFTRLVGFWLGVGVVAALSWLFGMAPKFAEQLGHAIALGARTAPRVWITIVADVVQQLTGHPVPPEVIGGDGAGGGHFGAALELARYIFDTFTGFIAPPGAITPEKGVENAVKYLSANLTLNMSAWYLGLIHEMTSLGISRALKELPVQISWAMGLGWLSWLVFGTPFRAAIADPLEVHYNQTYQFARLSPSQIVRLRASRRISDGEYEDLLAEHGFDARKRLQMLELEMQEPSLSQLQKWWELGVVTMDYVERKLERLGWREVDIRVVRDAMLRERLEDEYKSLVSTAEKLFKQGRLDLSYLQNLWAAAGLTETEREVRLARLELERDEERTLTKSEVLDAYRDGAIGPAEARARLRRMGYPDEDIDILLRREERRLSPAQVVDAAIRQLISREDAIRRLVEQGYSEEDAHLLLSLREVELTPGQIVDALEAGLLGSQEARNRLRRLGFRDEDIDILIAPRVRRLSADQIQEAYAQGLLTKEEATERLVALGYDLEDVNLILIKARRMLPVSAILEATRRGLMSAQEAQKLLQEQGYSPEDAALLVELRWRLMTTGQVLDAVAAGIIPYDEGRQRLIQLGYSYEDATILLVTSVRRGQPPAVT